LTDHYSGIALDTFVIMPNHVHGIIIITDRVMVVDPVGAGFEPAPTGNAKRHGLPEIIRAFKTFSARKINETRNARDRPVWQRNYYEQIIRNDNSYETIRQYTLENPLHWVQDEENLKRWAETRHENKKPMP
jgi:putative transposase